MYVSRRRKCSAGSANISRSPSGTYTGIPLRAAAAAPLEIVFRIENLRPLDRRIPFVSRPQFAVALPLLDDLRHRRPSLAERIGEDANLFRVFAGRAVCMLHAKDQRQRSRPARQP